MSTSPNKRAVTVGIFVVLGLVFLVAGILVIGNIHQTFSKKLRVTTLFNDVNGLQKGSNIWFSGVKIGTVKQVDFYGASQVKVVMNIDREAQQYIRKDAKVKISADGLIGNKILVIYGGSERVSFVTEDDTLGVEKAISTEDMMTTLQENNVNLVSITSDFKIIAKKLAAGEGTIGKLLNDDAVFNNIEATTASLNAASNKAQQLMASLNTFTSKLNQKGTLANDLVTDTVMVASLRSTVKELNQVAGHASAFISDLKQSANDPKSMVGTLLKDEQSAAHLKETMKNLDSGSKKLDEDLEALQHNFLLRKYFRKKEKAEKK
jgi:phospholipid/cholesterol/gamma-HCH transport system substrate-binding protein